MDFRFLASPRFLFILFLVGVAIAVLPYVGMGMSLWSLAALWVNGIRAGIIQVATLLLILLIVTKFLD